MPEKFEIGERVRLKKSHPCGGSIFEIRRVGMDFRIKCEKCGKEIWIKRSDFEKRVKRRLNNVGESKEKD